MEILVGKKPAMSYVLAALENRDDKEIVLKARGRSISRAVDVAEILRNRFIKAEVAGINIGTEVFENNGKKKHVSTIEIKLSGC